MPRKTAFQNKYKQGDRVEILGSHPWTKEVGSVDEAVHTIIGHGLRIKMDNGFECVVFKKEHLGLVGS